MAGLMPILNQGLGNATLLASGPYEVPNVAVDAYGLH